MPGSAANRNAVTDRRWRSWWCATVALYAALVGCLAIVIIRWAGLVSWGPQWSSSEVVVATVVVGSMGLLPLILGVWTGGRRPWWGVWAMFVMLIAVGGMIWFICRFATSWGS